MPIKDPQWRTLNRLGMLDSEGEFWRVKYDEKYVIPAAIEDKIDVKLVLTKDATNQDIMGAGAMYRKAELFNGGVYKVKKQAYKFEAHKLYLKYRVKCMQILWKID